MIDRRHLAVIAALVLGACGGGSVPGAPAPPAAPLGYAVPAVNPVTYASADTAHINIHLAPGQTMEQTMGQESTVKMTFAQAAGGDLEVTASYVDFVAFMESSMMPRQEVGNEAFAGDFVLRLSPEGEVELVSGPDLPPEVLQMGSGGNLFTDFFLRLPNELVEPGASWSDTIRNDDDVEGARTTSESVVQSTFRGDTTIAGHRLWVIESTKVTTVVVEGDMQGMSMRNELSGSIAERTLWDPARRVMYSNSSSGTMSGTVSIPGAGMNDIPIDVTNARSVRLVEGGS